MADKVNVSDIIKSTSSPEARERRKNPTVIKPKHRAILERMKQGETITSAMVAMSYAPSYVNRPSEVTHSKSWQALMDEQLPEQLVAERHREILNARRYRYETKGKGKNRREVRIDDGPDPMVMRGVELAYKLRGRTKDETPPADRPNIYNIFYKPDVRASVKAFEDTLKQSIAHEIRTESSGDAETMDAPGPTYTVDDSDRRSDDTNAGAIEGDGGRTGEDEAPEVGGVDTDGT